MRVPAAQWSTMVRRGIHLALALAGVWELTEPPAGWASLVVCIPVADGVVVAADSRTRVEDQVRDDYRKVFFIEERNDIAFTVTGITKLVRPQRLQAPGGFSTLTTLVDFDAAQEVSHYLTTRPSTNLSRAYLRALGTYCAGKLAQVLQPAERAHWANRGFCGVAVIRHEPQTHYTLIGTVVLALDGQGQPYCTRAHVDQYGPTNRTVVRLFGVRNYTRRHVLDGQGKRWLNDRFFKVYRGELKVADLSAAQAATLAGELIRATARTSHTTPIPNGITLGGPIQCFYVTGRGRPKPLDAGPPIPAE